ncbi:HK97 family phage prohead protease [Vibrio parahaemolyticus]|uniref:HK97 family phage prohead protease n=1 Tax=Vibrio parahaemolyticus TaxID=670 RepID=UPI000696CBC8|nr:HK97 family phage prohead protease [Vibrio parahaemolyticus]
MTKQKQFLDLQVKSFDSDGEVGVFEAYANTKWTVDRVRDCTVDNAYSRSIQKAKETGRMPKMLLQHDHNKVIGVWLEMEEDEHGLRVKGQLALETTLGKETYELIKMKALDSLSIGYVVKEERFDPETKVNYLIDIDIHEVSVVTFACNQESLITSVKSDEVEIPEEQETNDAEVVTEEIEEVQPEPEPNPLEVVEQKLNDFVLNLKLNNFLRSL